MIIILCINILLFVHLNSFLIFAAQDVAWLKFGGGGPGCDRRVSANLESSADVAFPRRYHLHWHARVPHGRRAEAPSSPCGRSRGRSRGSCMGNTHALANMLLLSTGRLADSLTALLHANH